MSAQKYKIIGKNKVGDKYSIAVDSQSGYPYWAKGIFNGKVFTSIFEARQTGNKITEDFQNQSGIYYKKDITFDSIEIIEIRYVPIESVSLPTVAQRISEIKKQVSPENFAFIMEQINK